MEINIHSEAVIQTLDREYDFNDIMKIETQLREMLLLEGIDSSCCCLIIDRSTVVGAILYKILINSKIGVISFAGTSRMPNILNMVDVVLSTIKNYGNDFNVKSYEICEMVIYVSKRKIVNPIERAQVCFLSSGTTGEPKVIAHSFESTIKSIKNTARELSFGQQTKLLSISAINWDVYLFELYSVLSRGGRVVMVGVQSARNAILLPELVDRFSINTLICTQTFFNLATKFDKRRSFSVLQKIIFTGEKCLGLDYSAFLAKADIYNLYGSSEFHNVLYSKNTIESFSSSPNLFTRIFKGVCIEKTSVEKDPSAFRIAIKSVYNADNYLNAGFGTANNYNEFIESGDVFRCVNNFFYYLCRKDDFVIYDEKVELLKQIVAQKMLEKNAYVIFWILKEQENFVLLHQASDKDFITLIGDVLCEHNIRAIETSSIKLGINGKPLEVSIKESL